MEDDLIKIHMLDVNKLKELKNISRVLKDDIQIHHNEDPGNIDDFINGQLYGLLESVLNQIDKIEQNNNIDLDKINQ